MKIIQKSYYHILEVSENANRRQIKQSFLSLVRVQCPTENDLHVMRVWKLATLALMLKAFVVLSSPSARDAYDRYLLGDENLEKGESTIFDGASDEKEAPFLSRVDPILEKGIKDFKAGRIKQALRYFERLQFPEEMNIQDTKIMYMPA